MDEEYNPFDVDDSDSETEIVTIYNSSKLKIDSEHAVTSSTSSNFQRHQMESLSTNQVGLQQNTPQMDNITSMPSLSSILNKEEVHHPLVNHHHQKDKLTKKETTFELISKVSEKLRENEVNSSPVDQAHKKAKDVHSTTQHLITASEKEEQVESIGHGKRGRKRVTLTEDGYISLGRPAYLPVPKHTKKNSENDEIKSPKREKSSSSSSDKKKIASNQSLHLRQSLVDSTSSKRITMIDKETSLPLPLPPPPPLTSSIGTFVNIPLLPSTNNNNNNPTSSSLSSTTTSKRRHKDKSMAVSYKSKEIPPPAPPRGYIVKWSQSKQRWYWYHKHSKQSQWHPPSV